MWHANSQPMVGIREGIDLPQNRPNWVSTYATDDIHAIEPFDLRGQQPEVAMRQLVDVISAMPRSAIVDQSPDYIHAEFTSRMMRYVDDAEFLYDADAGVIQFRSASRCGHSDLGVNRQRMEAIRAQLGASPSE